MNRIDNRCGHRQPKEQPSFLYWLKQNYTGKPGNSFKALENLLCPFPSQLIIYNFRVEVG
jgi:hypothetical protein